MNLSPSFATYYLLTLVKLFNLSEPQLPQLHIWVNCMFFVGLLPEKCPTGHAFK